MTNVKMPGDEVILIATLEAIRALGGSATNTEIKEKVIEERGFTDTQQSVPHKNGPKTELEYRFGWARTHLKWIYVLENSSRGVWSLTELGRMISHDEVLRRDRERRRQYSSTIVRARADDDGSKPDLETGGSEYDSDDSDDEWTQNLLRHLLTLDPMKFERLSQRLLREAGFINFTVTGRSGDSGIDAVGTYRLSLLSFPVFVQCKRYSGSVGPGAVRDFRGAMEGRGEKGLLITTGTFTREAQREATRDGTKPIELIDGERLCNLLSEYGLGVKTQQRTVTLFDPKFFDTI